MLAEATIHALNKHTEFYERAAALQGRARERMVALGEADELFFRLYPHHYRALQLVRVATQLNPATVRRRETLRACESRTVALLTQVISSATTSGDLTLPARQRPADIAFCVWALAFGTRALMNTATATRQLGIADGYATVCDLSDCLFDGLGWRPISHEWDYERTRRLVRTQIFGKEWTQAAVA